MNDQLREFREKLDLIPALPTRTVGEFTHQVSSGWIDGIEYQNRQSDWTVVYLDRTATNVSDRPTIEYAVSFTFAPPGAQPIYLTPLSALVLGQVFIWAGAAALADLAANSEFLQGVAE